MPSRHEPCSTYGCVPLQHWLALQWLTHLSLPHASRSDCDFIVDAPTVSGRHVRLEVVCRRDAKGGFSSLLLTDLGSTNGTWVNRWARGHRSGSVCCCCGGCRSSQGSRVSWCSLFRQAGHAHLGLSLWAGKAVRAVPSRCPHVLPCTPSPTQQGPH